MNQNAAPLTAEKFSDPFTYLDAKLRDWKRERAETADRLKAFGWKLRPNHPITGVWRARRWTKKHGAQRFSAPTSAELIRLAKDEAAPRLGAKAKREARKSNERA